MKSPGADPAAASPSDKPGKPAGRRQISPSAALTRHVEWLEFALAAARSEETWRVARLEKATGKNREKRTSRLVEVRDEIAELAALIEAIRALQARAARTAATTGTRRRATGAAVATPSRRRRAATPTTGEA